MGLDIAIMVWCPWIIVGGALITGGAFHKPRNYRDGIIGVLMIAFGIWLFVVTAFKLGL